MSRMCSCVVFPLQALDTSATCTAPRRRMYCMFHVHHPGSPIGSLVRFGNTGHPFPSLLVAASPMSYLARWLWPQVWYN